MVTKINFYEIEREVYYQGAPYVKFRIIDQIMNKVLWEIRNSIGRRYFVNNIVFKNLNEKLN